MIAKAARLVRRTGRRALQSVYGFDAWHVGHAREPYVRDIVRRLNARPSDARRSAVEIGCGLGDIIGSLHYATRLGLDREENVVRAARTLAWRQRGLRFAVFDFPSSHLTGSHDAIVMVNWIHAMPTETLRQAIESLFADHLRAGGCLVLDTVPDPAYTYNHDIHALAPSGASVERIGAYARGRDVWALGKPL